MFRAPSAEQIKIIEERFGKHSRIATTALLVVVYHAMMIAGLAATACGLVAIALAVKFLFALVVVPIPSFMGAASSQESMPLAILAVSLILFGLSIGVAAHAIDRIGKFIERSRATPKRAIRTLRATPR